MLQELVVQSANQRRQRLQILYAQAQCLPVQRDRFMRYGPTSESPIRAELSER